MSSLVSYPPSNFIGVQRALFSLLGANMNSTADQQFTQLFPFSSYQISTIQVMGASGALTGAIGGIYPAVSKGGSPLVAAGQSYAGVTGSLSIFPLTTTAAASALLSSLALYLSLTTPLGSGGTANLIILGTAWG